MYPNRLSKEARQRLSKAAFIYLEDAIENWSRVGKKYVKIPDHYWPVTEEIKAWAEAKGLTYRPETQTLNWKL